MRLDQCGECKGQFDPDQLFCEEGETVALCGYCAVNRRTGELLAAKKKIVELETALNSVMGWIQFLQSEWDKECGWIKINLRKG